MSRRTLIRRLDNEELRSIQPDEPASSEPDSDDLFLKEYLNRNANPSDTENSIQDYAGGHDLSFSDIDQNEENDGYHINPQLGQINFDPDVEEPQLLNIEELVDSDEETNVVSF